MKPLARWIGCTEGQVYTAVLGFGFAAALLVIGMPPMLRNEPTATAQRPAAPAGAHAIASGAPVKSPVSPLAVAIDVPPRVSVPGAAAPAVTASTEPPARGAAAPPAPRGSLTVVDAGYTSSTGGTPLSGPEVPQDGMPVGARLGQVDKMSFARLAGTGDALLLRVIDDGVATYLPQFAEVRACAVTEPGWTLDTPGAPPEDAPAFDDERCVVGAPSAADGTWRFDLEALGSIDPAAGIALVPVSEAHATFQITFSIAP